VKRWIIKKGRSWIRQQAKRWIRQKDKEKDLAAIQAMEWAAGLLMPSGSKSGDGLATVHEMD